jgi:hypothetical protein
VTSFLDGPAAGVVLDLRRAPLFLRAVCGPGGEPWDALDQLDDRPTPAEVVHVYRREGEPSHLHLLIRGARSGRRSGYYTVARYRYVEPQPPADQVRDTAIWRAWCEQAASAAGVAR